MRLNKRDWKLRRHDAYKGHLANQHTTGKTNSLIAIVANPQGINHFVQTDALNLNFSVETNTLSLHAKGLPITRAIMGNISSLTACTHKDTLDVFPGDNDTSTTHPFKTPREFLRATIEPTSNKETDATCNSMWLHLTSARLRHDWENIVYTDGLCQKVGKDGTRTGAAIYFAKDKTTTLINTESMGVTNTITRAELSAIMIALTREGREGHPNEDMTILTDSLTSLHLIRKAIRNPMQITDHSHKALLDAIVMALIKRSNGGLKTHIGKVRAHIGVYGNEMADQGAKQACSGDAMHDAHVLAGTNPYVERYWPTYTDPPSDAPDAQGTTKCVQNLHTDLKSKVHNTCKLGFSKALSYFRYWSEVNKAAHQSLSNAFWSVKSVPFSAKRYILQYRGGVLYNEKLAIRYGRKSNALCPMCHLPDSAGHMLGGCLHRHAKGMIIKRHNQATWDINNAISTGERGNEFTIIDAGLQLAAEDDDHWDALPDVSNDNRDDSPDLDCPQSTLEGKLGEAPLSANPDPNAASAYQPSQDYEDCHDPLNCPEDIDGHKGARIPKWMLPEIDDDLRNRLRPDILRIRGLPCTTARPPQSRHERQRLLIKILEIGFCSIQDGKKSSTRKSNNMYSSLTY